MSERYIDIPTWEKFQHKDVWRKSGGRPPWIKTYTNLLHNDDWRGLSSAQQGILLNLWLMYASAGRSVNEALARRQLSTNKAAARHWLGNLEALNHAGFIQFVSQPISAPVAPRVEKRREETISKDVSSARGETAENGKTKREAPRALTEAEIVAERQRREQSGYVDNLSKFTGCRIVRGEIGISYVYDPLGTEYPPADWPHERPTKSEVLQAKAAKEHAVA